MPHVNSRISGKAAAFGSRLRAAMLDRGLRSASSRSGVAVRSLADAVGISYEMARRYCEGAALPRPETLASIAGWLGVAPGLLAWGDGDATQVNPEVLEACVGAVLEAQARTKKKLSTAQAARLVAILYSEQAAGRTTTADTLDLMLRSV